MSFFDALASIILSLHLWCVGLAASAPFYSLWVECREAKGNIAVGVIGRRLAFAGILALATGILIGLFYGWMLYDPAFGSALGRLKSRVIFGIIELVFSFFLFVVHRWWWGKRPQARILERAARMILLFLAASNLAYHSPTFFAVLSQLRENSLPSEQPLSSADFRSMIAGPAVLSQVTHFLMASVMIGAASLLWLLQSPRHDDVPEVRSSAIRFATYLIGLIAVGQLVVGSWVSTNLTTSAQTHFTDLTHPIAIVFIVSLIASVSLIPHAFWKLANTTPESPSRWLTIHVALVVLLMSFLTRLV